MGFHHILKNDGHYTKWKKPDTERQFMIWLTYTMESNQKDSSEVILETAKARGRGGDEKHKPTA